MRHFIFSIAMLSIFGLTNSIVAQVWYAQVSNTTNYLYGVSFINQDSGWAVGDNGTILRTIDGGGTWVAENSGTTKRFNDVDFLNGNLGWAVGNDTFIVRTTNGGNTWLRINTGVWN
jgi:photosystem II stability/assembly factor-like uncharacterized protein